MLPDQPLTGLAAAHACFFGRMAHPEQLWIVALWRFLANTT
ncbi:MAG: hypothetical protein JG761_405 [Proteiniphilum sp.]|nr:hypothetical protein [Proteiniphilum sp.]